LTEQIGFVYVRAQTTKLVQESNIACSSSAMLEQAQLNALDMLISTRSTRRTCPIVSRRDVTSQVEFGLNRTKRNSPTTLKCASCQISRKFWDETAVFRWLVLVFVLVDDSNTRDGATVYAGAASRSGSGERRPALAWRPFRADFCRTLGSLVCSPRWDALDRKTTSAAWRHVISKRGLYRPHNWNKTETKLKQNVRPWNYLAVVDNHQYAVWTPKQRLGAGRWRMRDVVVVSAG